MKGGNDMAEFRSGDVIVSVDHSLSNGEVAFLQGMVVMLDKAVKTKTTSILALCTIDAWFQYGKAVKLLKEKGVI